MSDNHGTREKRSTREKREIHWDIGPEVMGEEVRAVIKKLKRTKQKKWTIIYQLRCSKAYRRS